MKLAEFTRLKQTKIWPCGGRAPHHNRVTDQVQGGGRGMWPSLPAHNSVSSSVILAMFKFA